MKYRLLSKEQFEALHKEFAQFLATQQIDVNEWRTIKDQKPEVAEEELRLFSDLVWEKVLDNAKFLEHFSKDQIHLFELQDEEMQLIAIKVNQESIDLTTVEGYDWLRNNLLNDDVVFYRASKEYTDDKNLDKFKLIQQGAHITRGELFAYFSNLVEKV